MLEATDREVLDKAFEEDRVLVTVNVGDFVKLARSRELHAGIVAILDGGLLRDEQIELMQRIVALVQQTDMANCVLSVALDGEVTFEQISSGA
jgi:predicted nuclease of predicted toxin-antitoxin system